METQNAPGGCNFALNAFQKDALNELGNIASGHALTALSELTSMSIRVDVPNVDVMNVNAGKKPIESDKMVVGTSLKLEGGFDGHLEVLFADDSALRLVDFLMGRLPGKTTHIETMMEKSVLMEIGNVLASAFCDAIAEFFKFALLPSPPAFYFDTLSALVEKRAIAVKDVHQTEHRVIRFTCVFQDEHENDIHGYILLFPQPEGLKKIVSLLEAKVAKIA